MLHARSLVLLIAMAPALGAQFSAFDWGLHGSGTEGATPVATVDGDSVRIHGLDDVFCEGIAAWVSTTAPVDGHVSFTAEFINPGEDLKGPPVAWLAGAFLAPPGPDYPSGAYAFGFDVLAGQGFGFGIATDGCGDVPGEVQVSDLLFEPTTWFEVGGAIDPRPWRDVPAPSGATGSGATGFGATLGAYGDLDGDGVEDLAVGAADIGHAYVISGADGSVLLDVATSQRAGLRAACAGDFDADGRPDLLVGLPRIDTAGLDAGRVEVYSGLDGSLLAAVDGTAVGALLGASVAPAGDVDGDGNADIVVGAPGDPLLGAFTGHAVVLGGPDGHVVQRIDGGASFGAVVTGMGDADGDGLPDVAVMRTGPDPAVEVRSGATGVLVSTATGFGIAEAASLAPMADHDGDGFADYAWGLAVVHVGVPHTADQAGRVSIRSGATGAVLAEWAGSNIWDVIGDVVASGDWNGDGVEDVAFVAFVADESGYAISRRVRLCSGAPGGELLHELRASAADAFGSALAAAGDLDGDGVTDLAVGAPGASIGVRCVHALDGNGTPRLQGVGVLEAGRDLSLLLTRARADAPVLLVASHDRVDLPLKGGVLVPGPDLVFALVADTNGSLTLTARWPAGIPGPFMVWLQAWIVDADAPHGFTATHGLGGLQP